MRRVNVTLATLVVALLAAPVTAMAASNETYRDKFDDGYFGSDGSLDWNGGWWDLENGSYGQDSAFGPVHVDEDAMCSGGCLHIENGSLLPLSGITAGAKRYADTSEFTTAVLYYRLGARSLLGIAGSIQAQVSVDGGNNWVTRRTDPVAVGLGGLHQKSVNISGYASESFAVRFLVTGLLGGYVFIDDVEIKGEIESTPSTTTTTTSTTTTTTTPSTTSTTVKDTTSTSRPGETTTTTTRPTTTSTEPTTTSTTASTTTTTGPDRGSTTSTTVAGTTSTTSNDDDRLIVATGPDEPPVSGGGDGDGGLHQAERGIQAGLSGAMFADINVVPMFDPVDVDFSFGLLTEEIETSWLWMTLFALVLTWALLTDLDRRRLRRTPQPASSPGVS